MHSPTLKLFTVVATLCVAVPAWAGPTVIKDQRVSDKSLTPFPGRGYSLSTNTLPQDVDDYCMPTLSSDVSPVRAQAGGP